MQTKASVKTSSLASVQSRVTAGLCAALLGVFVIWGVGFAQSATLHNAAHDGRHGFSFPCH